MRKRVFIGQCAAALALLFSGTAAYAAECDVRVSDAEVDYGALYREEIATGQKGALLPLGKKQLNVSILCDRASPMGLRLYGDPAGVDQFRFAHAGNFGLKLTDAVIDGRPVSLVQSREGRIIGSPAATIALSAGQAFIAVEGGQTVIGKSFSATIEVDTFIDDATTRVRDLTLLEGRVSLAYFSG